MKESGLQSDILNDLRSFGKYCVCFKIMNANENGVPDVFFTTKWTGSVFIEVKRTEGKARKLQQIKIDRINECGGKAFICNSWIEWITMKSILGLSKNRVL